METAYPFLKVIVPHFLILALTVKRSERGWKPWMVKFLFVKVERKPNWNSVQYPSQSVNDRRPKTLRKNEKLCPESNKQDQMDQILFGGLFAFSGQPQVETNCCYFYIWPLLAFRPYTAAGRHFNRIFPQSGLR